MRLLLNHVAAGILFLLSLGSMMPQAFATPIRLQSSVDAPSVSASYSWYQDASGSLSVEGVLPLLKSDAFKLSSDQPIPFAFSSLPFWIKFDVQNNSTLTTWYITGLTVFFEQTAIFELIDTPSESKWVHHPLLPGKRYATSAIDIPVGAVKTFLVRFATYDPPTHFFSIRSAESIGERDAQELPFYGLIAGIFLALILYNLFLYFSLRRSIHLYYVLFAAANAYMALMSVNLPVGIIDAYSLLKWGHFLRFIAPLTTFLLAKAFLDTRRTLPRLNRSFDTALGLYAALLLYQLVTHDTGPLNHVVDPLMLATIILVTTAAVFAYRKGNISARYFIMALGAFFTGVIVQAVHPLLGLPTNLYTQSAHLIGQAAEMVLMSLALASQIKSLEEEKVRAEATAIVKSKLLRVMSHDIMNPLSLIKGFAQIMLRKPGEADHLSKILRSASMIEAIVQFVVKYESRRGGHALQLSPVSLKAVFDELAFIFEKPSMEKGVKLSFEIDPGDLEVMAEKVSLTNEILANLISNAIKFSFVGSTIEVVAIAQNQMVSITIRDKGIGIPKDMLAKIFNPSANVSRQGTNGELGSGFGMPIVWSFVKELGGEVTVQSVSFDEDKTHSGTTVNISLSRIIGPFSARNVEGQASVRK